jgi:hypothetical protein
MRGFFDWGEKNMKRLGAKGLFIGIFLVAGSCGGPYGNERALADLLQKNTDARGGAEALAAVQAVKINIHIKEPAFEVDGVYAATREGKMRVDIFYNGARALTEAFDGKAGWDMSGDGAIEAESEKGAQALRHGILTNLVPLSEMADYGQKVVWVGRQDIGGINYYAVDLVFDDGTAKHYFIDPETFLVERAREEKPLHPDVDPTPHLFETQYSDFRTIAGVVFSFHDDTTDLVTGEVVQTTNVKSLDVNPEIDSAVFDWPPPQA